MQISAVRPNTSQATKASDGPSSTPLTGKYSPLGIRKKGIRAEPRMTLNLSKECLIMSWADIVYMEQKGRGERKTFLRAIFCRGNATIMPASA